MPLRELSEWLLNKELGNWIMILDGLDDASVLCEPQVLDGEEHAPLRQFIPEVEHGSILVTSRSSEEANRIVLSQTDHDRKLEAVGPLEHEEALDLLRTLLPGVEESTESSELLNILQNNPLAIHQAGSYIRENGLQLSAYTRLLNLHDESVELLLSSTLRGAREDESATRTIMATWQLTFDQIRRNYPKSVEILYVFAMFCEVPLPFEYLNYSDESPWDFVRKGFPIINHSIVRVEPSSWSSSYLWHAHPLVYFAIRRWMETQQADSLEIWQSRALKLIADKFPAVNHRLQWTECEKLIPHALKILGYSLTGRDNELNRASILYKLSCYDIDQNKHFLGLERAQEALRITRKHLGNDHEQTVVNVGQTARINMMLHRFKDAEGLFQEAIEIQKRINGPEDRQTIANMASLAMVWSRLGPTAWPQAEELMSTLLQAKAVEYVDAELEEEDVESQKTVLSEYDPLRLGIMTIQADIYSYRHEWLEAEKLESRVLQMRLWAGNEYPDIFWSMRNLSFTYLQMGLYEEAEAIKRHLVDYAMRELGPKHPETLQEMAMLARTLQLQGRGLEGDRLIINALEWHQDISGADHPGTIVMMGFKAKQHILAKEWFEAEKLLSEVIEMETRIYGPKNPSTLCSKGDLLVVYSSTDRSKQAVPMAEQLWKDFQETLGETHPQTVTALENYAYVCLTRGGWTIWKKGYDLATRANDLQRERLGPDHPKVVVAQKTLKVLENLGKGRPPFGKSHRVGKRLSKQAILGSIFPWRALRTFLDSAGRPQ